MRRFLLPLLTALALPTAVNANVDPKVAEMCMKAVDFQGCVAAMTGKKPNEYGEGTRKFVRSDGSLSLFNPLALRAMEVRGEYGRYLTYRYFRVGPTYTTQWTAEADCQDYTANWMGDKEKGWRDLKISKKESSIEAKNILDEFCPQMDSLVKEAKSGTKEYFKYPASFSNISSGNRGSGGGSGWKNQAEINNIKSQIRFNEYKRYLDSIEY